MEPKMKAGHPVLGIVLAILAILIALFMTLLTGVIGGGIALVLGVLAIVIGILGKKKGGKGVGAIVLGVIAVVMAIAMTLSSVNMLKALKVTAEKAKPGALIAQYCDDPYFGLAGIVAKMPKDQAGMEELMKELEELQALESAAATEAAAK